MSIFPNFCRMAVWRQTKQLKKYRMAKDVFPCRAFNQNCLLWQMAVYYVLPEKVSRADTSLSRFLQDIIFWNEISCHTTSFCVCRLPEKYMTSRQLIVEFVGGRMALLLI